VRIYSTHWTADGSIFGAVRLCFFCVRNFLGSVERICAKFTQKTYLVPRSDEFEGHVKGQGHGHQGQEPHFSALLAACVSCVLFVFGKTSLAFS